MVCKSLIWPKINIRLQNSFSLDKIIFIPNSVKYFGINTYTTGIFKAWFSLGDIGTAIQLACLLLLVVFFFFVLEKISSSKTKFFYETNSPVQRLLYVNKDKLLFFHLVCSIPFILGFFIPFVFIVNNVFQTYSSIDFVRLFTLSFNTIFVSSLSSFIIIIVALFFLFVEKRERESLISFYNICDAKLNFRKLNKFAWHNTLIPVKKKILYLFKKIY